MALPQEQYNRTKLDFILANLTPEDRDTFLKELGQEYLNVMRGNSKEISQNFWTEWYEVAEFSEDKEKLKRIDEMEKSYKDDINKNGLILEELCQNID